jgi:hypothetical protein
VKGHVPSFRFWVFDYNTSERASSSKMYFWVFVVNTQVSNPVSQFNLHYRWKSEDHLLLAFLPWRLRVSFPETPVFTRRSLWSGSGDSGLSLWGRFSPSVARPRYGGGDSGRKLLRSVSLARRLRPCRLTPETPGSGPRRLRPKKAATASPWLGL